MNEKRKLVTSAQLADELGLSRRTISRYAREGWLKPAVISAGNVFRWDVDDCKRQLEEIARKRREERP